MNLPFERTGRCAVCGREPYVLHMRSPYEPFCLACIPPGEPRRPIRQDERCQHCRALMAHYTPEGVAECAGHHHGATSALVEVSA